MIIRVRPHCHALALTAATALLAFVAALPAQAAAPGVVVNGPSGLSGQTDRLVAGLGVGWVRAFAPWDVFEPKPGRLDENRIETLEAGLAGLPVGTHVVLDVPNTPQWESGSANPATPPRNPADYAAFVGALAHRLAGRVAAWEIWNEEDTSLWWAGAPDPAAYAALLRASYPAIKAADPGATVVVGGLTGNNYEFLSQLYADGAKGSFDAVGVHTDTICDVISPYEYLRNGPNGPFAHRLNRWAFLGYRTVHEVMVAHGDASPIWMTELGWSTYSGVCNSGAWAGQKAGGVTPQDQAAFLLQAYHCLAQDPYVQVGIWFGMQDAPPFDSPRGDYGLLSSELAPKPAYGALQSYARGGDRLTEPCGNFGGPAITLVHPRPNARYSGMLPIAVRASDPFGVHQISLYHDGRIIRNFTSRTPVATLNGAMVWFGALKISAGRHVLTATATDAKGNVSSTSIVIYHGRGPARGSHAGHRRHARHARRRRHAHPRHRRHRRRHR
jgi:hypothetical protein